MSNKRNWQNLQLSMNNFHINKLMSYTDIQTKLKVALDNADKQNSNYHYAQRISELVNDLNTKDDFVLNNTDNQGLFDQISICMSNLIGSDNVNNQEIQNVNQLLKSVERKNPTYFKKFNFTIHKNVHISAQQAMFKVISYESEKMSKDDKSSDNKDKGNDKNNK